MNIKDRLAANTFKPGKSTHLQLSPELCRKCPGRPCLFVCPARVYTQDEQGGIKVEFEGCLECGTCLIACPLGAIKWDYPAGGAGVQLRHG